MRLFPVMIAIAACAPALPAKAPPLQKPDSDCPSATNQFARDGSGWVRKSVKPQKLGELPPADAFAAVYRLDERGCMVPVKFRDIRR